MPLAIGYVVWRGHWNMLDFVGLFLICTLILVTALGKGFVSKLLNNKLSGVLGSVTYAMYLNQALFIYVATRSFDGNYWLLAACDFICLAAFSAVVTFAYNKIVSKYFNK